MTTQAHTIEQEQQGAWAHIAATAFTLAVLGSATLWLVRPDGHLLPSAEEAMVGAQGDGAAARGGLRERYAAQQAPRTMGTNIADLDAKRAAAALQTLVVASPGDIPEAYARFVERHHTLDGSTPLAVTVVEAGMDRAAVPMAEAAATARTVYFVGSEAAAAAARDAWAAGESQRAGLGLLPEVVQVVVVATDEDASQVRVGVDGPQTRVIDLRGRPTAACTDQSSQSWDAVRASC